MSNGEARENQGSQEELEPLKALAKQLLEEIGQYRAEIEITERDYRFPEDHLSEEWLQVHYRLVGLYSHGRLITPIPFFSPPQMPDLGMIEICEDPNELNRLIRDLRNYLTFVKLLRVR